MKLSFRSEWGLGAQLTTVLRACKKAKTLNEPLSIELLGRYSGGGDWFKTIFIEKKPDPNAKCDTISNPDRADLPSPHGMTCEEAHKLFFEYVGLRNELRYGDSVFKGLDGYLGIHYRCGDKWTEASYCNLDDFFTAAKLEILEHSYDNPYGGIFVGDGSWPSTGCNHIEIARRLQLDINRPDGVNYIKARFINGSTKMEDHSLVEEAIDTIVAFSRCRKVIRTCSNLSAWAKIFYPKLKTITLNRPHADMQWWPEVQVIKEEE